MAEQSIEEKKEKKTFLVRLKDLYDAYKILVWLIPFFGAAGFDRFVNMWNVPTRLEEYRQEFIKTRERDIFRYQQDRLVDSLEKENLKNEIRSLNRGIYSELQKGNYELKSPNSKSHKTLKLQTK